MIAIAVAAALQTTASAPVASAPSSPAYAALKFKSEPAYAHLGPAGPYTPDMSVRMNQSGYVVLDCTASQTGALSDCAVVAEAPRSFSFGRAATVMAKLG